MPAFLVAALVLLLVQPYYLDTLALCLEIVYIFLPEPVHFSRINTEIVFQVGGRLGLEGRISGPSIVSNTALLWALVLITPGMYWLKRIKSFAGAFFILLFSQALFVIVKVELTLIKADHVLAGNPQIWSFLDDFFEVTGKGLFPIAIWIALTLPYLMGRVDARRPITFKAVSRNAPCPCGSGKKYKRCCG